MTDEEVMAELKTDSPLNRARAEFSFGAARIEQAGMQHKPPSPIDVRRMEFEAVRKILMAAGFSI